MKIEINFEEKIIKVIEKVNFKRLMKFVKTLPDWEQFEVDTSTTVNWGNPIVIERPYYRYNDFWYSAPSICDTNGALSGELTTSTYQLELKDE